MSRRQRRAGWVITGWGSVACLAQALFGLVGCSKPASGPSSDVIAAELVEAGCAKASPTLAQSVAAELEAGAAPAWASCLAEGGSVSGCFVPCDATTVTITRSP